MPTKELPVPLPTVRDGVQLSQDEIVYIVGIIGKSNETLVGRDEGLNVDGLYSRLHRLLPRDKQAKASDVGKTFSDYVLGRGRFARF